MHMHHAARARLLVQVVDVLGHRNSTRRGPPARAQTGERRVRGVVRGARKVGAAAVVYACTLAGSRAKPSGWPPPRGRTRSTAALVAEGPMPLSAEHRPGEYEDFIAVRFACAWNGAAAACSARGSCGEAHASGSRRFVAAVAAPAFAAAPEPQKAVTCPALRSLLRDRAVADLARTRLPAPTMGLEPRQDGTYSIAMTCRKGSPTGKLRSDAPRPHPRRQDQRQAKVSFLAGLASVDTGDRPRPGLG